MLARGENLLGFAPTRQDALALALLAASVLVFFAPAVFTGEVLFFRDISLEIVPKRALLARAGWESLWNPCAYFGLPQGANAQSAVFYPLSAIFLLLPVHLAVTVFVLAHALIALVALYILLRSCRLDATCAAAGAVAYAYGGYFASTTNLLAVMGSVVWIAPMLWALSRAAASRRWGFAVLAGGFWALQVLGGDPVVAPLAGLLAVFFLLGLAVSGMLPLARRTAAWCAVVLGVALVCALGLSAVQWVLSLELAAISNRVGGLELDQALKWSLEPGVLLTLLVPNYIAEAVGNDAWVLGFQNARLPYILSIYPGIVVQLLALYALLQRPRSTWPLLAGLGFFLLLSLGAHSGLYALLSRAVPGVSMFRFPERALFGFALPLSLLAALGLAAIRSAELQAEAAAPAPRATSPTPRRRVLLLGAALAIAAAGVAWLWLSPSTTYSAGEHPMVHRATLGAVAGARTALFLILALAALLATRLRVVRPRHAGSLLAVLLFCDLFLAHRHVAPTVAPDFYALEGHLASALPGAGRGQRVLILPSDRAEDRSYGLGRDIVETQRQRRLLLAPLSGLDAGVCDVASRSSFFPRDIERWYAIAGSLPHAQRLQLFAASGIRWVLKPHAAATSIEGAAPRAYVVGRARWLPDQQAVLEAMRQPDFDPRAEVLLVGPPPTTQEGPGAAPAPSLTPAEVEAESGHRVEIAVPRGQPGYLILLDTYYPGWRAFRDRAELSVYRANGFFRAVAVDGTGGRVVFRYQPTSFRVGLAASLATAAACLALLLVHLARARAQPRRGQRGG